MTDDSILGIQELERHLPSGGDIIGVSPVISMDTSSEAKIAQLEDVIGRDQKVLWKGEKCRAIYKIDKMYN